jgi:hypothetical protein
MAAEERSGTFYLWVKVGEIPEKVPSGITRLGSVLMFTGKLVNEDGVLHCLAPAELVMDLSQITRIQQGAQVLWPHPS